MSESWLEYLRNNPDPDSEFSYGEPTPDDADDESGWDYCCNEDGEWDYGDEDKGWDMADQEERW